MNREPSNSDYLTTYKQMTTAIVNKLGLMKHFAPWSIFGLGVLKHFGLKNRARKIYAIHKDFFEVYQVFVYNFCTKMFQHSRYIYFFFTKNNEINRLHERCLRLVYNNKKLPFENLLDKDISVSIHHKNLRSLAIEM